MSRVRSNEQTKEHLHKVVAEMYDKMVKGEAPTMTLPVRTKNNITFDSKLGVYKYGKRKPGKRLWQNYLNTVSFRVFVGRTETRALTSASP